VVDGYVEMIEGNTVSETAEPKEEFNPPACAEVDTPVEKVVKSEEEEQREVRVMYEKVLELLEVEITEKMGRYGVYLVTKALWVWFSLGLYIAWSYSAVY